MLAAAARHRGSAFVEILQNCNIYNDNAFDFVREEKGNRIYLEDGAPIRFGLDGEKGVVQTATGRRALSMWAKPGDDALVHDVPAARTEPRLRALAHHLRDRRRKRRLASSEASSGPSTTT